MEASLRVQKPLSDCSNTAAASTQSSTASSSTIILQNPTLSSVAKTTKNDAVSNPRGSAPSTPMVSGTSDYEVAEPCSVYSRRQTAIKRKSRGKENDVPFSCPCTPKKTWNVGKETKQDGRNIQSEMASTRTHRISSSTSDTMVSGEVYEPHSVYTRRQSTAPKRKGKGQEKIGASSCPHTLNIRNSWDNSNEDGHNSLSKAPCKKKVVPTKKETSRYTSPELEKQRAYFAELDKYQLPVEEAEEWKLD